MKIIEYMLTNNPCYALNAKLEKNPELKGYSAALQKNYIRYVNFQKNGPQGLMLHSVGCPRQSALSFCKSWNNSSMAVAVHAFIDGSTGDVYQTLPWNYEAWHGAGGASGCVNDTHVGVEMCEPSCITYYSGSLFNCSDLAAAREVAERTYKSAVELFAYLCYIYKLDPLKDGVIISHREGALRQIASNHADPEHLWNQLGMKHSMDGFRQDVKNSLEELEEQKMTGEELKKKITDYTDTQAITWGAEEYAEAQALGITDGTRPMTDATRQETACMQLRAYKLLLNKINELAADVAALKADIEKLKGENNDN